MLHAVDPSVNDTPVWSVVDARCATESAAKYKPMYQKLYSQVAAWRANKPTILRTINRYSDWIGFADAHLTHSQELKTKTMLDAWDTMLCATATANGIDCADVYHAFNGPEGLKAARPPRTGLHAPIAAGNVGGRFGSAWPACIRLRDVTPALPGEAQQHKSHQDQTARAIRTELSGTAPVELAGGVAGRSGGELSA